MRRLITEAIANREGGDLEKFETSRIKLDGKPRLRSSATMNWRKGSWGAAWSYTYVGSFYDTSACHDIRVDGDRCEYWEVEDWLTQNLQIDYRLRLNDLIFLPYAIIVLYAPAIPAYFPKATILFPFFLRHS